MKDGVRRFIHSKYGGHCAYCGEEITVRSMQVDHIIPKELWHRDGEGVVEYGLHSYQNLNPSCRTCNNWKHSFTLEFFRKDLEAQVERAQKYSRNFRMAKRFGLVEQTKTKVTFFFETYGLQPNSTLPI